MRNEKGVTLTALVVTIMVLLLLTTVVMNVSVDSYKFTRVNAYISEMKAIQAKVDILVEDSSLDKSSWTTLESIRNSSSDVYNFFQGIINNPAGYNIDTQNSWNQEFDGDIANYYYFTPEDLDSKLGLKNQELTVIINFKTRNVISLQYIKKDGIKYYRQYDLLGGNSLKNSYTLDEMISTENYGDYIDLGTDLLDRENITLADSTSPATDWRIFYKDENGVYAILANYLPVALLPEGHGLITSGTYVVKLGTSRIDLLDKLNDTAVWKNLLTGTKLASNSKITVKGALDLETWVASWNSNIEEYSRLATSLTSNSMSDGLYGYYVGVGNPGDNITSYDCNLSSSTGYSNTLYFPYKSILSNCYGYWLASPSAYNTNYVMSERCNSLMDYNGFNASNYCVRPAVYLPSDIFVTKDSNDVWQIN